MSRDRAKLLIEEARVVAEQDLTSSVEMLEEAYGLTPDPELQNEIILRRDALKKLDQARERFWSKYREDQLYSAYQILLGLPENYRFDQEEEILYALQEKFNKAESLVKEAKALPPTEHQASLDKFSAARELIPDFPGLAADISTFERTVEQGNAYLVAITKAIEKGQLAKGRSLLKRYREGYGDDDNARLLDKQIARRRADLGHARSARRILAAVFVIIASFMVIVAAILFQDSRRLDEAGRLWAEVREFRTVGRFAEASRKSEEIVKLMRHVYLLDLGSRELLKSQARNFLASQHRKEGLAGRLLVDGRYVDRKLTGDVHIFEKELLAADEAFSLGDPKTAAKKYTAALDLAVKLKVPEAKRKTIAASLKKARMELLDKRIAKVARDFGPKKAEAALTAYRSIQKDITAYNLQGTPVAARLSKAYNRTAFALLQGMEAQGERAFAMGDYGAAVKGAQEANAFAEENSLADKVTVNRLNNMIGRGRVSEVFARAEALKRSGSLVEALGAYRQVGRLAEERGLTSYEKVSEAAREVNDISLALDRQYLDRNIVEIRAAIDSGDLGKAAAGMRAAEERLAASEFLDTPQLASQAENLTSLAASLKKDEYSRDKKQYLEKRYAEIIRKAFSLPRDQLLLNPEIILLREEGNLMVFSLSAYSYSKKGKEGDYSVYHMDYAFNRDEGTWTVENKDMEERKKSDRSF